MAQEEVAAVAGTAQPAAQAPEEAELGNAADAIGSTKLQLQRVLADMEQLGIVTELAGKVRVRRTSAIDTPLRHASRAAITCADRAALARLYALNPQVVGGVALSASYYQHVLATEGRTDQVPPCQLLITRHRRQELLLLPAAQVRCAVGHATRLHLQEALWQLQPLRNCCCLCTRACMQAELEAGHAGLPREAPVLSKMMSPAALTELHWLRVPAVVIFGCFVADEEGE
jgi:hypothetical protein